MATLEHHYQGQRWKLPSWPTSAAAQLSAVFSSCNLSQGFTFNHLLSFVYVNGLQPVNWLPRLPKVPPFGPLFPHLVSLTLPLLRRNLTGFYGSRRALRSRYPRDGRSHNNNNKKKQERAGMRVSWPNFSLTHSRFFLVTRFR